MFNSLLAGLSRVWVNWNSWQWDRTLIDKKRIVFRNNIVETFVKVVLFVEIKRRIIAGEVKMVIPTLTNGFFPRQFQLKFQFPGLRKLRDRHPESSPRSSPWPQSPLHTHLEIDDYHVNYLHRNGRINIFNVQEVKVENKPGKSGRAQPTPQLTTPTFGCGIKVTSDNLSFL